MAQSESVRILYIEDDPGLARLVQKRLQRAGYVVDIASDGEEGIKKYEADSYDLLFVDQSLPVHDGLEIIRMLGTNGSLPPTVMITGTGDERVAVEAMKLGAGDYIVKDVEGGYLELLPTVIEKMLQQRRAVEEKQQVEASLRESEEKYRSLVEQANDGITVIQDGVIKYVNPRWAEMWGGTVQELIGAPFTKYIDPDELPKIIDRYNRRMKGKDVPSKYETVIRCKEGSKIYVELNIGTITYQGKLADLVFVHDITERKRMEQTLTEHKEALQNSFFGTAEALSKVIEDRDPYTSGHSAGVAALAEAMARVMGFPEDQLTGIHIAGVLHDIGKMAVPVEILVKPGRLTDMEMSLIQIHPQAGYEILQGIAFPWPVAQATLQHHERMDGSGYPQGLKGDQIIPEARILGVADVVDAMTHHRPYRPAFSVQDTIAELSKGRGRFYDPQVVDACLEVLEGKEAFTSSVYSMSSTFPQFRRGFTKSSVLPTTTRKKSFGRR
jgi:PAS domain S-box-containing protein/putative nucleotidyltransferase with HDIG domain